MTVSEKRIQPYFLDCDPVRAITAWAGSILNVTLILWCLAWMWIHAGIAPTSIWLHGPCALLALFLADLFSGLVHWSTDTWFDEIGWPRVTLIAREHHLFPHHIVGYGVRDYIAFSSWPSVIAIGPIVLVLTLALEPGPVVFAAVAMSAFVAGVMILGTYAHRLGHKRSDVRIVCWLQRMGLLMDTRHHGVHHCGNHDIRYCVINGWANHVCDRIGFWRALEAAISWATGAIPRANDRSWLARFERDRSCLAKAQLALRQARTE
jgi:ubiquitin-conjugating enzyme E2 variant